MKTYTRQEARNHMIGELRQSQLEDTDNEGQIVHYSGLYLWSDGSIRDYQEEKEKGNG